MLSFNEAKLAARMGKAIRRRAWPSGDYVTAKIKEVPIPTRDTEIVNIWNPSIVDVESTDYEVA